jgi:hypothetical protein
VAATEWYPGGARHSEAAALERDARGEAAVSETRVKLAWVRAALAYERASASSASPPSSPSLSSSPSPLYLASLEEAEGFILSALRADVAVGLYLGMMRSVPRPPGGGYQGAFARNTLKGFRRLPGFTSMLLGVMRRRGFLAGGEDDARE